MGHRIGMDHDLELYLGKLTTIQARVGGGREHDAAAERGGRGADRFLDLKEQMMASLKEIRGAASAAAQDPTANPKDQIARDAKIKKKLRALREDWHDLDGLVQAELRRKKPRVDADELKNREELVLRLLREIDEVKAQHRAGYAAARGGGKRSPGRELKSKDDHELFQKRPPEGTSSDDPRREQETISSAQQQKLQQLKERDRDFDQQIDGIGQGIDELSNIASMQNEEVKKQNAMLEDLQQRMDEVHDHVSNVNAKMKDTLDEVGRSSDKLCVDVMCLLFLIGMIIVLYQLLTSS